MLFSSRNLPDSAPQVSYTYVCVSFSVRNLPDTAQIGYVQQHLRAIQRLHRLKQRQGAAVTENPDDQYMTAPDVARALHISLRQARKLIRTGEIQGRRPGRQYVVHRDNLDAYVRGTTPGPDSAQAGPVSPG